MSLILGVVNLSDVDNQVNKFTNPGKMFGVSRLAGLFYVETSLSAESTTRMKLPCLSLRIVLLLLTAALLASGCTRYTAAPASPRPAQPAAADAITPLLSPAPSGVKHAASLEKMGYAIQVGAFSQLDNAVRLERRLNAQGIDAYYFRHESGLYKVRFSNHTSYRAARAEAEQLRAKGWIEEFFIVIPEGYAVVRIPSDRQDALREELVQTARRFLGVPYRWGGTDQQNGFDCSGLTLVCYRLNGLNLPRVSRSQFEAGRQVAREQLRPGDLVFFATSGGQRVSHVGLYIGDDQFIHAPRAGQTVRVEALSTPFYSRTYMGARSYF